MDSGVAGMLQNTLEVTPGSPRLANLLQGRYGRLFGVAPQMQQESHCSCLDWSQCRTFGAGFILCKDVA